MCRIHSTVDSTTLSACERVSENKRRERGGEVKSGGGEREGERQGTSQETGAGSPRRWSYLTECIDELLLKSQPPLNIVNDVEVRTFVSVKRS